MKKLKIYIFIFGLLLFRNGFCLDMPEKLATNIPGKMVFGSARTSDGRVYVYLLENGKITNLGIEDFAPRFSPNGRYVSGFQADKTLVLYDLKKQKIVKKHKIQYKVAYDHCWTQDGKYIIYGAQEELSENADGTGIYNKYVMKINVKNGKEKVLLKYENVRFMFNVSRFRMSPDNKSFLLTIGEATEHEDLTRTGTLYLCNLKRKELKPLWKLATPVGWYPDSEHILISTNNLGKNEFLKQINDENGRLYKVNIKTMETEIIEETVKDNYITERLSQDGDFIYGAWYSYLDTFNIVLAEVGKRVEGMMVTYPVPYTYKNKERYSSDSAPDWWYKDFKIKE